MYLLVSCPDFFLPSPKKKKEVGNATNRSGTKELMPLAQMNRIKSLGENIAGHLRSSFVISEPAQAVEELVMNSLDAGLSVPSPPHLCPILVLPLGIC